MSTTTNEPGMENSPVRLQEAAGSVADSASQAAQQQASRAMSRAGDTLYGVAQALRDAGNQMRQERPEVANLADAGAERIDQLSNYVREHDVRSVVDDAEQLARRQPAVVIAGGLALGLIVGRVLRSGAEPQPQQSTTRDWSGMATRPAGGADDLSDLYESSGYDAVGAGTATSRSAVSRGAGTSGNRSTTRSGGSSPSSRSKTASVTQSGD
jgi:ElaB/YqjD/DUF883 family membrane-anchored ribosome-binding protein